MSAQDVYPPGPPGTAPSPSDKYFVGLTYSRAKTAFWLGVFSLVCFGPFTGIPAVFVGGRALSDIEASGGRLKGRRAAWEGVILGTVGTILGIGLYSHTVWRFRG
ncbi:MAG: DUF4190 domain-containing protein [Nocardioides sp.]